MTISSSALSVAAESRTNASISLCVERRTVGFEVGVQIGLFELAKGLPHPMLSRQLARMRQPFRVEHDRRLRIDIDMVSLS